MTPQTLGLLFLGLLTKEVLSVPVPDESLDNVPLDDHGNPKLPDQFPPMTFLYLETDDPPKDSPGPAPYCPLNDSIIPPTLPIGPSGSRALKENNPDRPPGDDIDKAFDENHHTNIGHHANFMQRQGFTLVRDEQTGNIQNVYDQRAAGIWIEITRNQPPMQNRPTANDVTANWGSVREQFLRRMNEFRQGGTSFFPLGPRHGLALTWVMADPSSTWSYRYSPMEMRVVSRTANGQPLDEQIPLETWMYRRLQAPSPNAMAGWLAVLQTNPRDLNAPSRFGFRYEVYERRIPAGPDNNAPPPPPPEEDPEDYKDQDVVQVHLVGTSANKNPIIQKPKAHMVNPDPKDDGTILFRSMPDLYNFEQLRGLCIVALIFILLL